MLDGNWLPINCVVLSGINDLVGTSATIWILLEMKDEQLLGTKRELCIMMIDLNGHAFQFALQKR